MPRSKRKKSIDDDPVLFPTARLEELTKQVENDPSRPLLPTGRPRKARAVAFDLLADELAIKPASLAQRQRRAHRASEDARDKTKPAIDTMGVTVDPAHLEVLALGTAKMMRAIASARSVDTFVTSIHETQLLFQDAPLLSIMEKVRSLIEEMKLTIPTAICPWCKNLHGHVEQCGECNTRGVVTQDVFASAPQALRDRERLVVSTHGVIEDVPCTSPFEEEPSNDLDELWPDE
jgi:hypothetical protein